MNKMQVLDLLTSKGRTKNRRRPITREEAIAAAFVSGCRPGSSCCCKTKNMNKNVLKKKRPIDVAVEAHFSPVR